MCNMWKYIYRIYEICIATSYWKAIYTHMSTFWHNVNKSILDFYLESKEQTQTLMLGINPYGNISIFVSRWVHALNWLRYETTNTFGRLLWKGNRPAVWGLFGNLFGCPYFFRVRLSRVGVRTVTTTRLVLQNIVTLALSR